MRATGARSNPQWQFVNSVSGKSNPLSAPALKLGEIMNRRLIKSVICVLAVLLTACCSNKVCAQATFTWTNPNSGGNWSDTTNWAGGLEDDGVDNTANFNTLDLTADNTVTLDGPRTLGFLTFGDTTPSNNWIIGGTNTLTLQTTIAGTTPSINVVNQ